MKKNLKKINIHACNIYNISEIKHICFIITKWKAINTQKHVKYKREQQLTMP